MFALVDCNSFYCSCERVFHPETRGKPVIVLSNNDGCAIAFTKEAKALGINQMCAPFFEIKNIVEKHKVIVFSSNYALYDNFSRRVMSVLGRFTPSLEIYSVDEAFLSLDGFDHYDLEDYGRKIRRGVLDATGIPVGVGIAPTKVLSKAANKLAKKNNGVWVIKTEDDINRTLKNFPVSDLWGIGRASTAKLNLIGIRTALELKNYKNDDHIQKLLTKTGRQVQEELRGISCLPMEAAEDKKIIANTRSFGHDVYDRKHIQEAIATFATKAGEKLRMQGGVTSHMQVFFHTNEHKDLPQYYATGSYIFPSATCDTVKLIKGAFKVIDDVYLPGFAYKKGGVILTQIVPDDERQIDLFNNDPSDNQALSEVLDKINSRFGPKTIKSMACGIDHSWKLRTDYISKRFTTRWEDLLVI